MRGVRSRHCTPPSLGDLPMKKPAPAATHWCRTGNGFIFLDLASDRYFTLESGAADRFSLIVHRGQDAADDDWLAERGLHNLARPVDRIFPEAIAPTSSYLDSPGTERASAVDTIRAIYALALARRHVRKLRLAQILSAIPQFKPLPAEDQRSALSRPIVRRARLFRATRRRHSLRARAWAPCAGQGSIVGLTGWPGLW